MSVKPLAPFYGPSGSLITPSSGEQSFDAAYEADLVSRGLAAYVSRPAAGQGVPLVVELVRRGPGESLAAPLLFGARVPIPIGAPVLLPIPHAALSILPVRFYRRADGVVDHDFDPRAWEPATFAATYYVKQSGGNDANTGLSEAQALKTIKQALTLIAAAAAGNYELIVHAGYYDRLSGWAGTQIGDGKNLVVRCIGQVINSGEYYKNAGGTYELSWTDATNGAWSCVRGSVGAVYDRILLNADGDYTELTKLTTSSADCIAQPGTWYTDGTTLWVHPRSGLAPTLSTIMVTSSSVSGVRPAQGGRTIIYGMQMWGGADALSCNMATNTRSDVIVVGGEVKYGLVNDGDFNGARYAILYRVRNSKAGNDGFNYQMGANGVSPIAVEIECTGDYAGAVGTSNSHNGSSGHDGFIGARLRCLYRYAKAPVVKDVGGAIVWNIQCAAGLPHPSMTGTYASAWGTGAGATSYYDECVSLGGGEFDVFVEVGGTAYARNCTGFNRVSGTLGSYA